MKVAPHIPFNVIKVTSDGEPHAVIPLKNRGVNRWLIYGYADTWIYCRNQANFVYHRILN
jgi:hypothetical protein